MKVIVDTCVWSLALRRQIPENSPVVLELENLIKELRVQMIGPIRQELLSGIRSKSEFNRLRKHLQSFPDLPLITQDYESAAGFFNHCRAKGVQGSNTDFLICAVCARYKYSLFTTDKDFELLAQHLPIMLHQPRSF